MLIKDARQILYILMNDVTINNREHLNLFILSRSRDYRSMVVNGNN